MSKFIEYLGPEVLNYADSSGNTLFHYAVGCLDEDSIYKVISIRNITFICILLYNNNVNLHRWSICVQILNYLTNGFQLMENGASLMMKNKCEVLSDEDWGFDKATAKLVVGFQAINFQVGDDEVS